MRRIKAVANQDIIRELTRQDAAWKRDFPFLSRRFFDLIGERSARRVTRIWDAGPDEDSTPSLGIGSGSKEKSTGSME